IVVVVSISNALLTVLVMSLAMLVALGLGGRRPTAGAVGLYALYLAALAIIIIGFSLAASVLFLRYRDLNQVWEVLITAGFFVAPIIYPLGVLPERFHVYLYLWPPTPVIQFARAVLVDGHAPTLRAHALLAVATALALAIGVAVFRHDAATIAER